MKKVITLMLSLLIFSGSIFALNFDKSVGIDFSFGGVIPNFYMTSSHLEMQTGLSYVQKTAFIDKTCGGSIADSIARSTIIPSASIGYTTPVFETNTRFAIGLDDQFLFGIKNNGFSTGNLFSIYLRLSKPLDNNLELSGKFFIPMNYINVSTDSGEFVNMLPSFELFKYGFSLLTFEVRYYLGGL